MQLSNSHSVSRRISFIAILLAAGVVLNIAESMLMIPLPLPGARLGLANMVVLVAIYLAGWREVFLLAVLRPLFTSLLTGTFLTTSYFLSAGASFTSVLAMYILVRMLGEKLNEISVSIAGAMVHNLTQLLIAGLIIENSGMIFYLPVLMLFSFPAGIATGWIAASLRRRLASINPFSS